MLSNWALSNPSETNTLATSSPEPPTTGSLWQPKQEFESGPLVRLNGGLTPALRLVGMMAWVAFGRPAPSTVVNFALNRTRPRSISAGSAEGPAAATESKSRCDGEDALVPTASRRRARRNDGERAERDGCSQGFFHLNRLADGRTDRWLLFVTGRAGAARANGRRASPRREPAVIARSEATQRSSGAGGPTARSERFACASADDDLAIDLKSSRSKAPAISPPPTGSSPAPPPGSRRLRPRPRRAAAGGRGRRARRP